MALRIVLACGGLFWMLVGIEGLIAAEALRSDFMLPPPTIEDRVLAALVAVPGAFPVAPVRWLAQAGMPLFVLLAAAGVAAAWIFVGRVAALRQFAMLCLLLVAPVAAQVALIVRARRIAPE